jgi:alkaline phosphatase D
MGLDRREFLLGTASASAALLAACAGVPRAPVSDLFRHGVASGDPLVDGVVLWTRVTPPAGDSRAVPVRWLVARDPELARPVASGHAVAGSVRDFTLKVDARGLDPGTSYYYAFEARGGRSAVGRTRTLPLGSPDRLRLAFCSCASFPHGFFNAYALIARRADLDLVLHLGDYLYEYRNGVYGDGTALGRIPAPDRELVTLADYRTRHAQYKTDLDLQELHRQHPLVTVWDDHEIANNAWSEGAENHQEGEGPWRQRRRSAVRAYLEWMPVREAPADAEGRIYRGFRFGDLADLSMLDTRLVGRDRQAGLADRETLSDPRRTLLGEEQERWLFERLAESRRDGVAWRILGQQVMMAQLRDPQGGIYNPDAWDGYPESRRRLFEELERLGIDDTLVLSGDVHSSWANELAADPFAPGYDPVAGRGARAVEFVTPGISSPGGTRPAQAEESAREAVERHPHVRWVDLLQRGYALLDVDRERAQCEWYFVSTVAERLHRERFAQAWRTLRGRNHLEGVRRPSRAPEAPPLAP